MGVGRALVGRELLFGSLCGRFLAGMTKLYDEKSDHAWRMP